MEPGLASEDAQVSMTIVIKVVIDEEVKQQERKK